MTIQQHDFSRPPALHPDSRSKLVLWMTRTNSRLTELIAGLGLEVENQLEVCESAWPFDCLQKWPEKTLTFRIKLPDVSAVSLIAMPSPLAQVLIGTLLGEQLAEWPEDRQLTPGEESVGEFLLTTILNSLADSWTGEANADLQIDGFEPNLRRTKAFKYQEPFVVCRSVMKTPIGEAPWSWFLPQEFMTQLFGMSRLAQPDEPVSAREQLESLARDMTTEMSVRLGSVQLTAPQLAELRVGDLVVLNQKTSEPLRATVSGRSRYVGWPGRVGNRQAFELASDGPRRDRSAETASVAGAAANQ
jgi:flagellar motor switch protein FliM